MRIERIRVRGFGPLRDVDLDLAPGLNLIFGPNETGKTTLLDVILARLFRWERRRGTRLSTVMGGMDRFGDPGEAAGRLAIRLDGELVDYPGGPSLLHHLELEHAGLAGLFCVRSGELELPGTESGEFWSELKKVLSGLPRGVDTLRENAHEEAGLTPTGQISDAGDPGRKTRLSELRSRRERLEDLEERLPDAAEYEERISELEERKQGLERARRRRVAELRQRHEELTGELDDRPVVPESRLEHWRERSGERGRLDREIESLEEDLAERREELRSRREELAEYEARTEEVAGRVDSARELELSERAVDVRDARRELGARAAGQGTTRILGGGLLVAGVGAPVLEVSTGLLPGGIIPAVIVAAVATALGGWLLWRHRQQRHRLRDLERRERSLLEKSASLGLDRSSAAELPTAVRELEEDRNELQRSRDVARQKVRSTLERVEEMETELQRLHRDRDTARQDLEDLRKELEFESLEAAREAHERRQELEGELERVESALAELPDAGTDAVPARKPGGVETTPEWEPEALAEVESHLEEARAGYEELQHEFVRAGLSTPEDVLTELRECRAEIREIELDRDAGLLAGEIFASMDEALEQRLEKALSREGDFSVSGVLRRVTRRYVAVARNGEARLTVRDAEGREYRLEELSRGARDQVYLALRVGLAEAALEAGEFSDEGFLLLDDAFLTADWERRERMVEAVCALADRGWQVIYLTCDTHLRELFEEAGARINQL